MKDYVILYRKFRRGRRSTRIAFAKGDNQTDVRDARLQAEIMLQKAAPLGSLIAVWEVQ